MKKVILLIVVFATILFSYRETQKNSCLYVRPWRIFDGQQDAYITEYDILIMDKKIQSVHPRKKPPFGCKVIEAYSSIVIPGLIDSHTHLLLESPDNTINFQQIITNILKTSDEARIEIGKKNAKSMLAAGFTRVRDLGNSGNFLDVKLKEYLDSNPKAGPSIDISGPGIAVLPTQAGKKSIEYRAIETEGDIIRFLDENEKNNLSWVKVYADNNPMTGRMDEALLKKIVDQAHAKNLKVSLHAEDSQGVLAGIELGVESIEHAYQIPDLKKKKSNAYIVLTDMSLRVCSEYQKFTDDTLYKNCMIYSGLRAHRRYQATQQNLKVVFGSDSYQDFKLSRGQSAIESLIALQEQGFTPFRALQTAGTTAAEMLGVPDEGKISAGSKANLVILDGNPLSSLEDLKNIKYIIKDGIVISEP